MPGRAVIAVDCTRPDPDQEFKELENMVVSRPTKIVHCNIFLLSLVLDKVLSRVLTRPVQQVFSGQTALCAA